MIEQKAPLGFPEALLYLNSDSGDGNNLNIKSVTSENKARIF